MRLHFLQRQFLLKAMIFISTIRSFSARVKKAKKKLLKKNQQKTKTFNCSLRKAGAGKSLATAMDVSTSPWLRGLQLHLTSSFLDVCCLLSTILLALSLFASLLLSVYMLLPRRYTDVHRAPKL